MSQQTKEKGYPSFLSFLFSTLFLLLAITGAYIVTEVNGPKTLLQPITPWEFLILTLATFRLTRLFVYDSIMQFFRDFFLEKKSETKDGRLYITRSKSKYSKFGFKRLFADLLDCPWCTGVWMALIIMFLFYISPYSWPFLVLLSVAGASSFIQISINKTGWQAEKSKIECQPKN